MIDILNDLSQQVEATMGDEFDVARFARGRGVTEYHVRRMFSSLAGMSLSEYVRRRKMSLAAADLIRGDGLLDIAVRYGYGSAEAFSRAFRSVHGIAPAAVRDSGGPLQIQPQIHFTLTIQGGSPMRTRIASMPAFDLVGFSVQVPLIYEGANPHISEFVAGISKGQNEQLKALPMIEPEGILAITGGTPPDAQEGTELTYTHGVAVPAGTAIPGDMARASEPAGDWVVFTSSGPHPQALPEMWAKTATEWFPSNPWQLRPGPSILAIRQHNDDFTEATCDLWMPVEPR